MSPAQVEPSCTVAATDQVVAALVDGLRVRGEDPELDLHGYGSFVT
jgi:hypothetical protein